MTLELVDGMAGRPHIDSRDMSILHQGLYGRGSYVLDWGDRLACTMQDANHAVIGTGAAMLQGLSWTVTSPETVRIDSGGQGEHRRDMIVAHYHRDAGTGIETVSLDVVKGTPSYSTAARPGVDTASQVVEGAADAYMPLWEVPVDGITAGTPVRVAELLSPISSITSRFTASVPLPYMGYVTFTRMGSTVHVDAQPGVDGHFSQIHQSPAGYRVPEGYRPAGDAVIVWASNNKDLGGYFHIAHDGTITINGSGSAGYWTGLHGSWVTDDPTPEA